MADECSLSADASRIANAARECADACRDRINPRLEVAVFTRMLVVDLGWDLLDAQEVACSALRLLDVPMLELPPSLEETRSHPAQS